MTPEIASIVCMSILAGIVAMLKFIPRKDNPGQNALDAKYVRKELWDERSKNIEQKLDALCKDVKTLLLRE